MAIREGVGTSDVTLTKFDSEVAEAVEMTILDNSGDGQSGFRVPFQFPPKVISEKKHANFITIPYPAGWEPVKWYMGSEARTMTLDAEWIATGDSDRNFSPSNVAQIMRNIKRYFYQASPKGKVYPVVRLKIWEIVPEAAFFRLHDFSINFGPEIVKQSDDNLFYPLYSKASFNLELVTNLSADPKLRLQTSATTGEPDKPAKALLKSKPLEGKPLIEKWF